MTSFNPGIVNPALTAVRTWLDLMEPLIDRDLAVLRTDAWVSAEPLPFEQRMEGRHIGPAFGERWGDLFDCAWFRLSLPAEEMVQLLKEQAGDDLVIRFDCDGEGLVVGKNGEPLRGLTSVTTRNDWPLGMWGKRFFPLDLVYDRASDEELEIWIEAGSNDLEGQDRGGTLREASLSLRDEPLRRFYYDLFMLHSYYSGLETFRGGVPAEDEAFGIFLELAEVAERDDRPSKKLMQQATAALDILSANADSSYQVVALGHAHLDLLFLWPPRETWRKHVRTTSTVLDLMKRYPFYKYAQSQAQLYAWTQALQPGLWEQMKERYKEGRWDAPASLWVETDTNLPDGESLLRQALYGQLFMREHFGTTGDVCFLPDGFGFTAALPQILNHMGITGFLTQKMSQNLVNAFPWTNFVWRGQGGAEVVCHFLPEDTYSSQGIPWVHLKAEQKNTEKELVPTWLELFGVGDGGGGPGPEHLERVGRSSAMGVMPRVTPGTLSELKPVLDAAENRLPRWAGELYFEKHQGTFTTLAQNKRLNRRMEETLREVEALSVLLHAGSSELPKTKYAFGHLVSGSERTISIDGHGRLDLRPLWHEVLLMQFHDCLTGTSIDRVYDETDQSYAMLIKQLETIRHLLENEAEELKVLNVLPEPRNEWVESGRSWHYLSSPGWGLSVTTARAEQTGNVHIDEHTLTLSNDLLSASFNGDGTIREIQRTDGTAVTAPDGWGHLRMYVDEGDAWDINKSYHWDPVFEPQLMYWHQEPQTVSVTVIEDLSDGPWQGFIFHGTVGDTVISRTYKLNPTSDYLTLILDIDLKDENRLLRLEGDWDLGATQQAARCGIAFGERIRTLESAGDQVSFAYPVENYVALEPGAEGLALLTGDVRGMSLRNRQVSLNLLRTVASPSVQRDLGLHRIVLGIMPYDPKRDYEEGLVRQRARQLRHPLKLQAANDVSIPWTLSPSSLEMTACKWSEDGEDIIVRLLNPTRRMLTARFQTPGLGELRFCDGLEDPLPKQPVITEDQETENCRYFNIPAEQIVTLRFKDER